MAAMFSQRVSSWLIAALPGSALVLRGRLWLGAALLLPSLLCLVLLLLAPLLSTSQFLGSFALVLLLIYLSLAGISGLVYVNVVRPARVDEERVRTLHRQAAAAYLTGDLNTALTSARALAAEARKLPGAWRLLAMVADAAGDRALAGKARRTLQRLEDQAET